MRAVSPARAGQPACPEHVAMRGFVALALLWVLIASGGVLSLVSVHDARLYKRADTHTLEFVLAVLSRSARAADALMAHTSLYLDFYGAAGAGPGHLPCPDTDAAQAEFVLSRAGPNPPCASLPFASGAVPMHVTVPGLRAGIDVDAGAADQLSYRVRAAFVNNPIGRLVNSESFRLRPLEMIAEIGIDKRLPDARPLVVSSRVLRAPVERRVATWLMHELLPPVSALPALWGRCGGPNGCSLYALNDLFAQTIEGVARDRHWFFRNEWHLYVQLQLRDDCQYQQCRWRLAEASTRVADQSDPVIRLQLSP